MGVFDTFTTLFPHKALQITLYDYLNAEKIPRFWGLMIRYVMHFERQKKSSFSLFVIYVHVVIGLFK